MMTTMPLPRTPLILALLAATAGVHATDTNEPQATRLAPVHVDATSHKGYQADNSQIDTFGSFGNAPLQDTPAAITVITRDQIDDRQPHTLSELARGDAALGDSYAPVGYYQDVAIRGFALDLATGYRLNEMTVAGEQPIALEDKERVEILKGLGGLEAGVVAPGGLVNYVSKRAANVRSATVGTDSKGSRYVAVDVGAWLSPTFGLRVNAAHDGVHSYVDHADGRRNFLSLAADWKISPNATLQLDGNYQSNSQRSVSGYQLLGGTTLPAHPSRTRLLGFQPWQQPVGVDSANLGARFDYRFNDDWNLQLGASHSRSVIDDNVAFAYGCGYAASCANSPGWFFAPNGDYDVYDYRSPDDTRVNDEARAVLTGAFDTGAVSHEISLGTSAFRRTNDRRADVYDYVGTANIDQPEPPVFAPSPNQPGASVRRLTSWQHALFAMDRLHLGSQWQLLAGGRFVRLHERANDSDGVPERDTRISKFLPQTALLWQPTSQLTTYLSYSENLSLGNEAPYWTSNDGQTLAPQLSRQTEAGVKYAASSTLNLSAALYQISLPYQFARPDDSAAGFTFVQQGKEVHRGMELNAAGQLSDNLRLTASVNWIQARSHDTGAPSYEGHQVVNVPQLRTALYVDYSLPFAPGLGVLGGWRYAGSNVATPDGVTRVPAYHVVDAGLRYVHQWDGHTMTWRLNVDNLFNRFYWRDTGSSGGDSYLFPGAPRLARLSVTIAL